MTIKEREKIFNHWFDQYRGTIFKVVRAYGDNHHDQQELFQEICLQLWKSVPNYRGDAAVFTWVYRVAIYTALAWIKRERKQKQSLTGLAKDTVLLDQADDYRDQQLEWVYRQINQLNEIDRSLMLLWLDQLSYRTISEVLGISESNVGVKINRIKKSLTEQLKNLDHEI